MNSTVKEEITLRLIHGIDQVEPQPRPYYNYNLRAATILAVLVHLLNGKAKRMFNLTLIAALVCLNTGCSISLTRNNYYSQTDQAKSEATKKDMKHNTETRWDETAN